MKPEDRNEFAQVVRATFDNYGRPAPLPETLKVWWAMFESFGIQQFRMACLTHMRQEPKFPPSSGQLLALMGHREPGRLGCEEAWARAVKACDETETVVMNDEIAEAWGIAKPIMDLGDEVGARMAFKEAYERITANATGPAKWWPSIGSDPHKRDAALAEAKRAGLLSAPAVAALLPPPAPTPGKTNPEGIKRLKAEMERLRLKSIAEAEEREAERQLARDMEEAKKRQIAAQVSAYQEQRQ